MARLREQLADAVAVDEAAQTTDMNDAQEALAKAEAELAEPEPKGSRVVRKLKEAAELLTEGARTADAGRKAGAALLKLAPVAAALYRLATGMFGG